jgi:aromatic ring-opening dioxygenase catalytic subunit (LigB family)
MSFHNLRAFRSPRSIPVAEEFDAWLARTMALPPLERAQQLQRWSEAPSARQAHPREDHLLPLMVATGAALDDPAVLAYHGTAWGMRLSAYHFGA